MDKQMDNSMDGWMNGWKKEKFEIKALNSFWQLWWATLDAFTSGPLFHLLSIIKPNPHPCSTPYTVGRKKREKEKRKNKQSEYN